MRGCVMAVERTLPCRDFDEGIRWCIVLLSQLHGRLEVKVQAQVSRRRLVRVLRTAGGSAQAQYRRTWQP